MQKIQINKRTQIIRHTLGIKIKKVIMQNKKSVLAKNTVRLSSETQTL